MAKAQDHYALIAKKYGVPVPMANAIGPCDGFFCGGQSAVWNAQGKLLGQLQRDREGILIVDTRTDQVLGK
jgi:predicted amidohydrolase